MQTNSNLIFETIDLKASFTISSISGDLFQATFEDAPTDFSIGQNSDALIWMISPDIRGTFFSEDGSIILYLNKQDAIPQSFSLRLDNVTQLEFIGTEQINLHVNSSKFFIELSDCIVVNPGSNVIHVLLSGQEAKIEFKTTNTVVAHAFQSSVSLLSVDDGRLLIPASKRIPEFIISIYDDIEHKRPRPSRFGVPVISTVPGFAPNEWWDVDVPIADLDLIETGVGTDTRKMYFRVVSDQNIDVSVRDNVSLIIDLPGGVDTVVRTVTIPLTYNGTSTGSRDTNDVFEGSYIFHKEDTVNFVDGFAYLSVKMPLRIQRNLPLMFQVSSDGSAFDPPAQTMDMLDILSLKSVKVVQDNSKEEEPSLKSKNKKSGRKPKE